MSYIFLVIPGLVAGYYILTFVLTLGEKEHLRADVVPKVFHPEIWKSAYLDERVAAAEGQGMIHCGDYHTGTHSSIVKGPMRLYLNPARTAIVAMASARFAGIELRKTFIRTRLPNGRVIETNDSGGMVDITGGTEKNILWYSPLEELITAHESRLESENLGSALTKAEAFPYYERIELERGQRMVDLKLAKWTDPSQSTIRRTIMGTVATMRANKTQSAVIVKRERDRIEKEKQEKVATGKE